MEFKEVTFWIRLLNLPIGFRNKEVAEKIGNNLGTFLEFDGESVCQLKSIFLGLLREDSC